MAQHFWLSSSEQVGASLNNISYSLVAGTSFVDSGIVLQSGWGMDGEAAWQFTLGGNNTWTILHILSVNGVSISPSPANEMYVKYAISSTSSDIEICPKINNVSGDYWSYGSRVSETRINRNDPNRTVTTLASGPVIGGASGRIAKIRVYADNSNHKMKKWNFTDAEPSSWTLEATDATYTGSSIAGFVNIFSNSGDFRILEIGIGTDGDPAPTEPIAPSGPTTPTGLITSNITANSFRAGWTP